MPIPESERPSRRLLRDVVHQRVADAILEGQLLPGERLLDEQIGAWLGASRTPIREAMYRLQREGLVEIASNRHTKVASPTLQEARDAIEHLDHLLDASARCYSDRLRHQDRDRLLNHISAIHLGARPSELELESLWDLHAPLVRASGNRMFKNAVREAHIRARFALRTNPTVASEVDCSRILESLVRLGADSPNPTLAVATAAASAR